MTLQDIIHQLVESPRQLELLVAMAEQPSRTWTERDVANWFAITPWQAARELERLCARNVLEVRIGTSVNYRFAPGREDLAEAVHALVAAYRARPAMVAGLVAAQSGNSS